jgi:hypothetical protein
LDGIVIDSADIKYLPRSECQKQDTKIWKIAMWGGEGDINLINKLSPDRFGTIAKFMEKHSIESGVGFGLLTHDGEKEPATSKKLSKMKYLDADSITRYYTPNDVLANVTKSIKTEKPTSFYTKLYNVDDVSLIKELNYFRRLGDMKAYKAPHIVVTKGLRDNKICASLIDADCSFKDGVYGFYSQNTDMLKVLLTYFNSRLSYYFILMTSSSYGIEREQIMKEEFLSIPINLDEKGMQVILDYTSDLLERKKEAFFDVSEIFNNNAEIENIIYKSLGLDKKDAIILNDAIEYGFDLFQNKEHSSALHPIKNAQLYTKMICFELNSFLEGQDLYANATLYAIDETTPLAMVKLSFSDKKAKDIISKEDINIELARLNKNLWEKLGGSIYFRKKLNYYDGDDIYVIRPNQKRFWSQSLAIDDAAEIILECLSEN